MMLNEAYLDMESTSMHARDSETTLFVTEDLDTVQIQRKLLFTLNKIVNSETDAYSLTRSGEFKMSSTGAQFQESLKNLTDLKRSLCEYQQLHPTIQLFSNTLEIHNLTLSSASDAARINRWLKIFREEANSMKHRKKLRNFQRAASKNLKGTLSYVDHLFERHSRLLVVRVDLSYQKAMIENKTISTDLTRRHRKRLFKQVHAHPLFKHCLGYIWKLEYGRYKGFHYHTCFFFDGSKVRGDIRLARRIGEYWAKEVTGGQGLYFNCNAIASSYLQSGIGHIHYTDQVKRAALGKAITYIAKVDTAVRLLLPMRGRTFGRSEYLLRHREKRGRPR
ncbi:YagK/YfjJ domain-containing protein [Klebsiella oxytoca]|uniref:YagK/YfjJ domain-containing protein n=1 Tax=Klebsiella oxytoca TaxID=571 RepID=UPI0006675385|nr:inovirus-type Gp2 protein [Klebsiella oxytoca]